MNKTKTFLSAAAFFAFMAGANAQSNLTGTTKPAENRDKTETPATPSEIDKKVVTERAENVTKLEPKKEGEAVTRKIDLEAVNTHITELEALIEKNKNNADFNAEAYNKRLTYLKELKANSTEK